MIHHVAMRVKALHDAGLVHRDLKPANIMNLTRENCWTIIDFGCVATIGDAAPTAFSIGYAAPEVIQAYRDGRKIIARESIDAWSLGVIAYELLTGEPAVDMFRGPDKVLNPSM